MPVYRARAGLGLGVLVHQVVFSSEQCQKSSQVFCLERQIADSIRITVHQLVRPGYKEYKFKIPAVL